MEKRSTDYILIADTAANKEAINNIKEDLSEVKEDVHDLGVRIDALDDKIDQVLKRLDANSNQMLGAGRLVKVIWFAFPTLCAIFGWLIRGEMR